MTTIAVFTDQVKGFMQERISFVRTRLLGANNERLDFLMDSFYKLNPPQRTAVLAGMIGGIAFFVVIAFGFYFAQINGLKKELSNSFAALHELQALKDSYELQEQRFNSLVSQVRTANQVQIRPFLEKIAQDVGVQIEDLNEQKVPFAAENPLAEKMQEVKVDIRLPKISIPRLLNYLIEIEKSNSYLRVEELRINGRYGTKLYFDAQAKVRGYSVSTASAPAAATN